MKGGVLGLEEFVHVHMCMCMSMTKKNKYVNSTVMLAVVG